VLNSHLWNKRVPLHCNHATKYAAKLFLWHVNMFKCNLTMCCYRHCVMLWDNGKTQLKTTKCKFSWSSYNLFGITLCISSTRPCLHCSRYTCFHVLSHTSKTPVFSVLWLHVNPGVTFLSRLVSHTAYVISWQRPSTSVRIRRSINSTPQNLNI